MEKFKRIIFYDFETTGLWSQLQQPIEVYMKIIERDKEPVIFQSLIKPPCRLNKTIIDITGITDEMLAEQGRDIMAVFVDIDRLLYEVPETLLVGYYNRKFDDRFLNHWLMRAWDYGMDKRMLTAWDTNKVYDCAARFKADLLGLTILETETRAQFEHRCMYTKCPIPHKLQNALEYYKIEHDNNFHRAGADAEKAALLFDAQTKGALLQ